MVKYANKYFLMDNFRKLLLFLNNGAQWCLKFQQQLCTQPGSRRLVWHGGHAHVAKCCFHRGIYIISKTPWSPVSTKRLSLVFTANVGVRGQFLWSVGHGGTLRDTGIVFLRTICLIMSPCCLCLLVPTHLLSRVWLTTLSLTCHMSSKGPSLPLSYPTCPADIILLNLSAKKFHLQTNFPPFPP